MVKRKFEKQQCSYSLILMDYNMPIYTGCQATVMIKEYLSENSPELPHPYIVCLTSFTGNSFEKEAKEAGMDFFQAKPIFRSGIQRLLINANMLKD